MLFLIVVIEAQYDIKTEQKNCGYQEFETNV